MADRPFSWAVWVKPTGDGAILSKMDSARGSRGCDLFLFADRKVGMHIIADWPANAMKVLTSRPLPADEWSHIVATYDGSSKAAGVALYVNGEKQERRRWKSTSSTAQPQQTSRSASAGDRPIVRSMLRWPTCGCFNTT